MTPSRAPSPDEKAPREPGEQAPRRRKPWWRRWLRRLFLTGLLFLLLLILLLALVPSIVSSGWVRRLIVSKTGQMLDRPVTLDQLSFSWSGAFGLDNFSIGPKGDEPDQPLFALGKVRVRWAWAPFFSMKLRLDECRVEGFRLTVARSRDGVLNLLTLVPPTEEKPREPEPERPGGEPFRLKEFPIERLNVIVDDFRIDYFDDAVTTDSTLRAGFRIGSLRFSLPAPDKPATLDVESALYVGDEATSLPIAVDLRVTPGSAGYLDWQALRTRLDVAMPEQEIRLLVERPGPDEPGLAVELLWDLAPSVFVEFAKRGLPFGIPAAVEGSITGRLRAGWDAATSASLTMGTTWRGFGVQADAMGPHPLRFGDLGVFLDVGTVPSSSPHPSALASASSPPVSPSPSSAAGFADSAAAGMPPFSAWDLRALGFRSDFLEIASVGKFTGLAAGGRPHFWLTWDVRHDPASLAPILSQLDIPLAEQVGIVRSIAYSGVVRGGLDEPIELTGIVDLPLAPLAAPAEVTRIGLIHKGSFDPQKDRFNHEVALGEFPPVFRADGGLWKSEEWMTVGLDVAPVVAPDRQGRMEALVRPGPFVDLATHLGFAPEGFPTTGSLKTVATFAQSAEGDLSAGFQVDGAVGVSPAFAPDSPLPPPVHGLRPLAFAFDKARLDFAMAPGTPISVRSTGAADFTVGWDAPASMPLQLQTGFGLPVSWTLDTIMAQPGPIEVSAAMEARPAVRLGGAYHLDVAQPVRAAARVVFDPATSTVDIPEMSASVADWVRCRLSARAEDFGRERMEAETSLAVDWGDGLLAWIPKEIPDQLGGLTTSGTTVVVLSAHGRWDPERGDDPVETRLDVTHTFDGLRIGPSAAPLVRGRDWSFRLGLGALAAPANLLQPVHLTASAAMGQTDTLGLAVLQAIDGRVHLDVDPAGTMPVEWEIEGGIGRIASVGGPLPVRLGPLRAGTDGRFDVQPMDLELKSAWFDAPGFLVARADARFTSATRELAFHATADAPSLGAWVRLPLDMVQDAEDHPLAELPWSPEAPTLELLRLMELVPPLDARAGGSLSVEGTLPTPEDLEAMRLPMKIVLSGRMEDFVTTLPAPASTVVSDFDQAFALTVEGSRMEASAPGSLGQVHYSGAIDYTVEDLAWDGTVGLDLAAGSLSWDKVALAWPGLGISVKAEGAIDGWGEPLQRILEEGAMEAMTIPDWLAFAQDLLMRSRSSMVWESADWLTFAPSEAKARGRAEFFSRVRQEPGREVESVMGAAFDNFELRVDPFQTRVSGVTGSLEMLISGRREVAPPPAQRYLTDRLFAEADAPAGFRQVSADGLARILSPVRPDQLTTCRIKEIAFQQWAIRGITLRSEGDLRRWSVYGEIEDLMSGKARGVMRMAQAIDGGWDLEVEAELTGVSGRSAIPAWRNLPASETELSGVGHFKWHLAPGARTPEEALRGIDIRFVATHIGARALQSFILALDPEEKNPSFVAGRQALNLGRPNRFVFTYRNGLMDMEAGMTTFAGIGFSIPLLKRAAVGEVFRLEALRPQLEAVLLVRQSLDTLKSLDVWATPGAAGRFLAEIPTFQGANP